MEISILVIENEFNSIKGAFEAANLFDFDSKLKVKNLDKAQDVNFDELSSYDVIFLDISLAIKSELDGFGIIQKIKTLNNSDDILSKIVVITGDFEIDKKMEEKHLHLPILKKHINFNDITKMIKQILKK
ncbi:MAG: hypothetical protein LBV11_05425 [Bacillus cereus]|jgi:CheY-like chemotaxis protein|nr:hypothetical protein [Bacillus cereus]